MCSRLQQQKGLLCAGGGPGTRPPPPTITAASCALGLGHCLSAQSDLSEQYGPGQPGNAASSPGSPFDQSADTSPGRVAEGVYAGSQPQSSDSPNSVSQHDVACFQVSQH